MTRLAAALGCLLMLASGAFAQTYPTKPIRLFVGAPAGGTTDILARGLGQEMGKALGQSVVIENRAGAGGNIAAEAVAKADPDGYTLLMCFTSHSVNPSLYAKLPFDPVKDFTPISLVASSPSLLVANPSLPASSLQELVAAAKAKPGTLNFAIGGTGSSLHMAGELFKATAGVDIANIPYRGSAPALNDVISGQVELMFASMLTARPHLDAGKLKLLGVTSAKRMAAYPDAPAIGEILPGYVSNAWFGLLGPAKLPDEILQKLSRAAMQGAKAPEFAQRISADGAEPVGSTPEEFRQFLQTDIAKWARVVKATGAKID